MKSSLVLPDFKCPICKQIFHYKLGIKIHLAFHRTGYINKQGKRNTFITKRVFNGYALGLPLAWEPVDGQFGKVKYIKLNYLLFNRKLQHEKGNTEFRYKITIEREKK